MSAKTFTGLTGAGTGDGFPALDGCPYASCHHHDFATGYDSTADLCRDFKYDVNNTQPESLPDIVIPNDRPVGQTGAWVRLEKAGNRIVIEFDAETDVTTPYRVYWLPGYILAVEHNLGIPDPLFYSLANQNGEHHSPSGIIDGGNGNISWIEIGFEIPGTWNLVITPSGQGEPGEPGSGSASVSDAAYDASTWDGDTTNGASKNALRDKIVSMDSAISGSTAKTDLITITQATDLDAMRTRVSELDAAVVLKGVWDASAGTFPGGGAAQAGDSYIVSVGGTVNGVVFTAYDRIVAITDNASTSQYENNWLKLDYSDLVTSVAGKTGNVSLSIGDILNLIETLAGKSESGHDHSTGTQVFEAVVMAISCPPVNKDASEVLTAAIFGYEIRDIDATVANTYTLPLITSGNNGSRVKLSKQGVADPSLLSNAADNIFSLSYTTVTLETVGSNIEVEAVYDSGGNSYWMPVSVFGEVNPS
ncbi:MAG: hypothetical protein ABIK15_07360 [Pseudomonadota bacterium]